MDPTPFEDAPAFWAMTAQLATILMAVIMFGVFLFLARPLLVPLLAALIVAFTIGPLTGYAVKHGLPAWVPAVVIVTIIGAMFYFAVLLLADPISDLIARSGEIGANIKDKFRFMERPLTALKELYSTFAGSSGVTVDVSQPTEVIGSVRRHHHAGDGAIHSVLRDAVFLRARARGDAAIHRQHLRDPGRPIARHSRSSTTPSAASTAICSR